MRKVRCFFLSCHAWCCEEKDGHVQSRQLFHMEELRVNGPIPANSHLDDFKLGIVLVFLSGCIGDRRISYANTKVQWALQIEPLVVVCFFSVLEIIWLCKMTVIYNVGCCNWGKYYSPLICSWLENLDVSFTFCENVICWQQNEMKCSLKWWSVHAPTRV